FPPPAPGPVTEPPPPGETGDVMPAVVNGMLVVSAFRILPVCGSIVFTWRVILRDREAQWDDPATYTVTRVRWTPAAPGAAAGKGRHTDADANENTGALTWPSAARPFARMLKLDAAPHGEDPPPRAGVGPPRGRFPQQGHPAAGTGPPPGTS